MGDVPTETRVELSPVGWRRFSQAAFNTASLDSDSESDNRQLQVELECHGHGLHQLGTGIHWQAAFRVRRVRVWLGVLTAEAALGNPGRYRDSDLYYARGPAYLSRGIGNLNRALAYSGYHDCRLTGMMKPLPTAKDLPIMMKTLTSIRFVFKFRWSQWYTRTEREEHSVLQQSWWFLTKCIAFHWHSNFRLYPFLPSFLHSFLPTFLPI